jgi:SpoIID/LytB domain protein
LKARCVSCGGGDETITAINDISVEEHLKSVISSEMSAEALVELLKAHAITSRSWLVAMLERQKNLRPSTRPRAARVKPLMRSAAGTTAKIIAISTFAPTIIASAIRAFPKSSPRRNPSRRCTRGVFLVYDNEICDARYSKSCGGISEAFENSWEDIPVPYLRPISDAPFEHPRIATDASRAMDSFVTGSVLQY